MKLYIYTFIIIIGLFGCSLNKTENQEITPNMITKEGYSIILNYPEKTIIVKDSIRLNYIYKYMNTINEPYMGLPIRPKSKKEERFIPSSCYIKLHEISEKNQDSYYIDKFVCNAFLFNDTLEINISIGDGYNYRIIDVFVMDTLFIAFTYHESHMLMNNNYKPTVKISQQELTLDKSHYLIGDSLFGHIYLKSFTEDSTLNYVHGYFRSIVKKIQI